MKQVPEMYVQGIQDRLLLINYLSDTKSQGLWSSSSYTNNPIIINELINNKAIAMMRGK